MEAKANQLVAAGKDAVMSVVASKVPAPAPPRVEPQEAPPGSLDEEQMASMRKTPYPLTSRGYTVVA